MPIEYEMKYLFDIVVDAISQYSEEHMSAHWFINIEYGILNKVVENDPYILSYFKNYQISAMRELIRRELWVKWSNDGYPVLSPDPIYKLIIWDDTKPTPCGAD